MSHSESAENYRLYDYRYRDSKYFLQDQLRFSDAVQDVQSVKQFLSKAPQFSMGRLFQLALEPVGYDQ